MYEAIICKIQNVRNHPNADKLNLATVSGFQIVIGKEHKEGELGIFFPCDGQLTHEHCMANNLYRKNPETNEPMGGLFEKSRRVKSVKLRGEYSNGFWQPISSLAWCGKNNLKEGDLLNTLNGHKICDKYYTPETLKRINNKKSTKKTEIEFPCFHKHIDTKQLRYHINKIPKNARLYISEKLHGTSGRTGRHKAVTIYRGFFHRLYQKIIKGISIKNIKNRKNKKEEWKYVTGSRNILLDFKEKKDGFYKGTNFREDIHKIISSIGLHKGETLYYEIVGYTDNAVPIMGSYQTIDKDIIKEYSENIIFSYGCSINEKLYDFYVYRITLTNEDGIEIDYSWPQVKKRCMELGLKTPNSFAVDFSFKELLLEKCREYVDKPSSLDNSHPTEGVVVRVEHEDMFDFLKYKGDIFCELEGIRKNSDYCIDEEEIS
jgi:RNA ligase (TIGR02306 family)